MTYYDCGNSSSRHLFPHNGFIKMVTEEDVEDMTLTEIAQRINTLEALIHGTIERCQGMGYVGQDGQFIKQLRAAVEVTQ
jgi:hypothetical protein